MSSSTSGPNSCSCCSTDDPVRFGDGQVTVDETDLSGHAFGFSWGHTRSYGNQLTRNNTGFNGNSWLVSQVEYLVFLQPDLVAVMRGMNTTDWLRNVEGTWRGDLGSKVTMVSKAGDWQVYNQSRGLTQVFWGNDAVWYLRGQLKQVTNAAGNVATISRDGQGNIIKWEATDGSMSPANALRFDYTYHSTGAGSGRLNQVVKISTVAGVEKNIRRVTYGYYGISDPNGNFKDLKSVEIEQWTGTDWISIRKNFYRYYLPGDRYGFMHGLKFVMGPESIRQMVAAGVDPDTAPDEDVGSTLGVAGFADNYFRYDERKRATMERLAGGSREFTFAYFDNPFTDGNFEGYNFWKIKTLCTQPDGSKQTVYTNFMLQPILTVYHGDDKEWYSYLRYDDDGRTLLSCSSQSVSSYDELLPTLVTLKANDGLIFLYRYYESTDNLGSAKGFLHYTAVKRGEHGNEIKQSEYEYVARTTGAQTIFNVAKSVTYMENTDTEATGAAVATKGYSWYPNTLQIKMLTLTLPVVGEDQHGDGESYSTDEFYDADGFNTWSRNELGVITRRVYDKGLGRVVQLIEDVNTSQATGVPSGWMTVPGNGLNLVTDYEYDQNGRETQQLGPIHNIPLPSSSGGALVNTAVRTANYTVYRDDIDQVWTARGYASGSAPGYNYVTMNPVSVICTNAVGQPTNQILAKRDGAGRLSSSDSFPQENWLQWTSMSYDRFQRLGWQRYYYNIPSTQGDAGVNGYNFDQIDFGYDLMARKNRERSGGGTITRTVRNARNQLISTWKGTNDTGATNSDPSGNGAIGNNMVQISYNRYDYQDTDAYQLHGNGLLTAQILFADSGDLRTTHHTYDWRGRLISSEGEEGYVKTTSYNNRNLITQVERREGSDTDTLLTRAINAYDPLERKYQQQTIAVEDGLPTGKYLQANNWYDGAGQPIKSQSQGRDAVLKTLYDSIGRVVSTFLCYPQDGIADGNTNDIRADIVIEQNETLYDDASNVIGLTRLLRFHDATGTGPLNGPDSSQPKSRNYFTFQWPDGIGRIIATADYGTNSGSTPTRPAVAPTSSTSILVDTLIYDQSGNVLSTIDPSGVESRITYDSLGRKIKMIENYTGGNPDGSSNRTTQYSYNPDGILEMLTFQNSDTGAQVTRWQYGTTLTNSQVASSKLLRARIFSDSDDAANPLSNGDDGLYDRLEFSYNRLGQATNCKDQNDTVHAFEYDKRGRRVSDLVTILGSGVDGEVRRIQTNYDNLDHVTFVTSYDAITEGNIVNQIAKSYNPFGQITNDAQSHSGIVTAMSPSVLYKYADGEDNSTRPTHIIYPDGRNLQFGYGLPGSLDAALSRLATVSDISSPAPWEVANYSYLGIDTSVVSSYLEPQVELTYIKQGSEPNGAAGDPYSGLDTFGRNIDHRWVKGGLDIERLQYGYNLASLRQWRLDTLAHAAAKQQDNYYHYDGLGQVVARDQGQLANDRSSINGTPVQEEDWIYDCSGNWKNYQKKSLGITLRDQTRTHNKVNEIKTYDGSSIPVVFDPCGNMTRIPRQLTGTSHFIATWDAWNRLTRITSAGNLGAYGSYSGNSLDVKYAYDGDSRRTTKDTIIGNKPGKTHYYYNSSWKCIEERHEDATCASQQFIFGARGRNDLIFRDHLVAPISRHYALCDNMGSKVAITDKSGAVQERYTFSVFGDLLEILSPEYNPLSESIYNWETLFHGEVRDSETGFYNYGYRYYLPMLGRWPSRDPIGENGGFNLYAFVDNNGVNRSDLLGLEMTMSECEDQLKKAQSDPKVVKMLDALKNSKDKPCPVTISCDKCPADNPNETGSTGNGKVNIHTNTTDVTGSLIHELTHALQDCSGTANIPQDKDVCSNCVCRETQAYGNENPSMLQEMIVIQALASCGAGNPGGTPSGRCTGTSYDDAKKAANDSFSTCNVPPI